MQTSLLTFEVDFALFDAMVSLEIAGYLGRVRFGRISALENRIHLGQLAIQPYRRTQKVLQAEAAARKHMCIERRWLDGISYPATTIKPLGGVGVLISTGILE